MEVFDLLQTSVPRGKEVYSGSFALVPQPSREASFGVQCTSRCTRRYQVAGHEHSIQASPKSLSLECSGAFAHGVADARNEIAPGGTVAVLHHGDKGGVVCRPRTPDVLDVTPLEIVATVATSSMTVSVTSSMAASAPVTCIQIRGLHFLIAVNYGGDNLL